MPTGASTSHFYRPKLLTVLSEGYRAADFRKDCVAALTVAVVALPLSMAIAVASGVSPERGLYTAIVGGFLVSALGGSRFQIGGPAGAFIVLVAATVQSHGLEGLLLATLMSGVLLMLAGAIRLGSIVRHIPHAVTVGFTSGIAIIILASQLKELGGLTLAGPEPGPLLAKLAALNGALGSLNPFALGLGFGTAAIIFALKRYAPRAPGMLIAVVTGAATAALLHLPVETIGTRFGAIPRGLPDPHFVLPSLSFAAELFPAALAFALLGAIESLLSAKVADGMTNRMHRSNMELVAQGVANIGSAIFGGISVTGTIARTATNIRAGAKSPVSGMLHAVCLLLFMAVAAPLVEFIPLSVLAGVLVFVCWNMVEKREFAQVLEQRRDRFVLLATFGVTLAVDLTAGIAAGCLLAGFFHLRGRKVMEEGP